MAPESILGWSHGIYPQVCAFPCFFLFLLTQNLILLDVNTQFGPGEIRKKNKRQIFVIFTPFLLLTTTFIFRSLAQFSILLIFSFSLSLPNECYFLVDLLNLFKFIN